MKRMKKRMKRKKRKPNRYKSNSKDMVMRKLGLYLEMSKGLVSLR